MSPRIRERVWRGDPPSADKIGQFHPEVSPLLKTGQLPPVSVGPMTACFPWRLPSTSSAELVPPGTLSAELRGGALFPLSSVGPSVFCIPLFVCFFFPWRTPSFGGPARGGRFLEILLSGKHPYSTFMLSVGFWRRNIFLQNAGGVGPYLLDSRVAIGESQPAPAAARLRVTSPLSSPHDVTFLGPQGHRKWKMCSDGGLSSVVLLGVLGSRSPSFFSPGNVS